MRKTLVFAILATVVFAGCSQGAGSGPKENREANSGKQDGASGDTSISVLLSHAEAEYAKTVEPGDKYIKKLNELSGFNLSFEFLGHADYDQQLSLRFASGELADLVRTSGINSTVHEGAVEQGIFKELGPLLEQYGSNLMSKIPATAWNSPRVSKDGKIYGIPVLVGTANDRIGLIRKDWLDTLGMGTPETMEDWLAYFEAVKKEDMNGNGDPDDEYGVTMFEGIGWSSMFFGSFGVDPGVWHMEDGKLVPDMISPKMKEAFAFFRKLYENGYVNRDLFTKKESDFRADIYNGKSGSLAAAVYQYLPDFSEANAPKRFVNQPDQVEYEMVAPPVGPYGDRSMGVVGDGIYFVWVIPETVKNPEKIISYLNWAWGNEEADNFFAYGIEGENYTVENGEIRYDSSAPINSDKNAFQMYQLSVNPREIGFNNELVLKMLPESEKIISGYKLSAEIALEHDSLYMPALETFKMNPEISTWGSMFVEVFANVMTGKAPLDSFDTFVEDWKKRGGDKAIEEATAWYNEFH
ncbi:extracellular solute-binding protein [Paenibacillus antri]|uniref:Extracellular solute-binding protein n=1 Tax=Paenibacillus antri TaxID=2582848 RepID=A0A5R9GNY7_9BACL|nr:extracellular solute-binding protein [Paenibacillus antri]TLS53885.1 extracellular solute-binding protein [Paenibacillus antri]